jgi:UDP-galactopyranose mutase
LVKEFLATNNVTALEHLPYSPDLIPANFHLFSQLKSAMKGRGFIIASDIIKNDAEELKRLSQNGFQECFQHLYSRLAEVYSCKWGLFLKKLD